MLSKNKIRRSAFFILFLTVVGFSFIFGIMPSYAQSTKTLINLNTANQKELESIKGVGPATAKKIIAIRPLKSFDDLKKAGLSEKAIESIKSYATIGTATTPKKVTESKPPVKAATEKATPKVVGDTASKLDTSTPPKKTVETKPPSTGATKTPTKSADRAPDKLAPGQKVNINTATKAELEALPEIGPVKAQAIIDGRPFKTIEDIMKVKGIKEGTFNKIKGFITVR